MKLSSRELLADFELFQRKREYWIVRKGIFPNADGALWKECLDRLETKRMGGRDEVKLILLPKGGRAILTHFRHGGLLQKLRGDKLFGANRVMSRLICWNDMWKTGLTVPEPLGLFIHFYAPYVLSADFLSSYIEDAYTAYACMVKDFEALTEQERESLVGCVARAIAGMHEAGYWHNDLNCENIIVKKDPLDGWHVWLIDFDRASGRGSITLSLARSALERLNRSFVKRGVVITQRTKTTLLREYCNARSARHKTETLRCDGCKRIPLRHRLYWRYGPRG